MSRLKRSTISVTSIVAAALVLAVAASSASHSPSVLRVHAAGGGGGGFGIDQLTIAPRASLTARLAVNVSVSYVCRFVIDPNSGQPLVFFSSFEFASVQERTGKTVANGSGFASGGTAICDEGLTVNPTVNQATILVTPDVFPASGPFKNGTALASVNVSACPNTFVVSGVPPPCDFGSVGPTVITIK